VKVEIGMLDSMLNAVSELYSVRLGLIGVAKRLPHTDETRRLRDDLLKLGLLLDNRVGALEESIVEVRLVPVSILFERYRGEVRRLARLSDKQVRLEFEGEGTRIDRSMLDNLHDPLLHIIRNAVDHGIETPAERRSRGKPEEGTIVLRARQEASHICIEVEDDGRGVDAAAVREKALEKGIPQAGIAPPLSLIFEPGMSTRGGVSDISGRGVGLDAAKSKISAMKGMITVNSVSGEGARFAVYVPLTLAISRGVLVEESGLPAVVPLRSVIEVLALRPEQQSEIRKSGVLTYRGSQVKATALSEMLNVCDRREARLAVVIGVGEKRRALLAQRVAGEADIVSRPLPEAMVAPGFLAGATELHDGRPAIIIQPEDILREHRAEEKDRSPRPYLLPNPSAHGARMQGKSVRLLIFDSEGATYGLCLDLLKEVITLRSVTAIPVLGDAWRGVFFNRGMCHGLLRVTASRPLEGDVVTAAVLGYPERCGVGMSHIHGNITVPLSNIVPVPENGNSGVLRPWGELKWQGRDVVILTVGTRSIEDDKQTLRAAGRKG
jgi:chemotaxis protein histidine kinase CheA/chemotaxis signal transduction protein